MALPGSLLPLVEGIVAPERLVPVEPHDTIDLGGLEAHVVPAFHGVTMEDAYGDGSAVGGRPRFVGYVLGADRRVYHAATPSSPTRSSPRCGRYASTSPCCRSTGGTPRGKRWALSAT